MSEKPLSDRQKGILEFVWRYTQEHGRPPTIREIGARVDISSTSVVNYNLDRLEEKGFLDRDAEVSRGLRLTEKAMRMMEFVSDSISRLVRIPLAGNIQAGSPIEVFDAYDEDDAVELSSSMLPPGRLDGLYALRVSGESMIDAMVNDGDIVIMRMQNEARNGDMVAALVHGDTTTLKYFYNEGNRIRLQPANPTMEPLYFDPETVRIQGKVMMVVRKT